MSRRSGDLKKKRELRKRDKSRFKTLSSYRQAALSGEMAACYINEDWKDDGFAAILTLRRTGSHGLVLAAFYIDLWCCGLKDAWGKLNMTMQEFEEDVYNRFSRDVVLARVDPVLVRRLVGGGVRFARRNGFRLPPRYERWVSILGNVDSSDNADLSDYGFEDGRLNFVGNLNDLRRRLIGCSVEEFLARKDVYFTVGDDEFTLLNDDELGTEETSEKVQSRILDAAHRWCFAHRQTPHPRLPDAVALLIDALLLLDPDDVIETPSGLELTGDRGSRNLDALLEAAPASERAGLTAAFEQLMRFVSQYPTPAAMIADLMPDEVDVADE